MHNFFGLMLALSAPLVLAAMGGFMSERGGVINIGLEGLMLISACACAIASPKFGPFGGLAFGLLASVLLSIGHWLATQVYRIDHVISGMAVNALALGGSNFLFEKFSETSATGSLPHLPEGFYIDFAYVVPFVLWFIVGRTRAGLNFRAVGSDPDRARLAGLSPQAIRFWALILTGVLSGIAGVLLVSDTGVFTNNMTAGKGYIALAALIVGGWRPLPTLAACLAFGFFLTLEIQLQGTVLFGFQAPSELWTALPYLATVVALAGFLGSKRTPAGLGKL